MSDYTYEKALHDLNVRLATLTALGERMAEAIAAFKGDICDREEYDKELCLSCKFDKHCAALAAWEARKR